MKISRKVFRVPRWQFSDLGVMATHALRSVFGLDIRSLAVFRMLIASILLIDLVARLPHVGVFQTDEGILSRSLRLEMQTVPDPHGFDYQWSLHLFSGHAWGQYTLMAVAAFFAAWLLIGYRTRLATVISWAMFVSMSNRNPLTFDAGDAVLRTLMFWAMFVPLGAAWSVDTLSRRGNSSVEPTRPPWEMVVSFGSAALICQLLVVYFSAALFKMNPVWLSEFSGVYYALNCDPFVTRLGLIVREFPQVMRALTTGTIVLEFFGPLAMLVPWWNWRIRVVVVTGMCCMHLGMAATMTLGIFPWICIAAWLMLVPPQVWRIILPRLKPLRESRFVTDFQNGWGRLLLASGMIGRQSNSPTPSRMGLWGCRTMNLVVALLFCYAIVWNAIDVLEPDTVNRFFPHAWNRLARVLALEKNWCMFAPIPRQEDGWPIFQGTLRDGSIVNLWQPNEPLPWKKPRVVSDLYRSQRWRRYLENLTMESHTLYRPQFADWLQQRWNRRYAGGDPQREVATVEMLRQLETTPPPGEPFPEPETIELWTKQY